MNSLPGDLMPTTVMPYLRRTLESARETPRIGLGGYILTMAKSSSNSMKSIMRPETRWATRSPASASG